MATAGAKILASDINELHLHARGQRTTNSSTTSGTTELGVLRIDNLDLKTGKVYEVRTSNLRPTLTVGTDRVKAQIRYSSSGAATTTSTEIGRIESATIGSLNNLGQIVGLIFPTADEPTASILLTIVRASGTGTINLIGEPTIGISMWVICRGDDPGDTGTDI